MSGKQELTEEQSYKLLDLSVQRATADASAVIPSFNKQPERVKEVLVDMTFNLGRTGISNFKETIALIEKGRYKEAAVEMLDSRWAKQVGQRAIDLSRKLADAATTSAPVTTPKPGETYTPNPAKPTPNYVEAPKKDMGYNAVPAKSTTNYVTPVKKSEFEYTPQAPKPVKPTVVDEEVGVIDKTMQTADDASQWAKRKAQKEGLMEIDDTPEVKVQTKISDSGYVDLGKVKGEKGDYAMYVNTFDNSKGFNYLPIKNVGASNAGTKYKGVKNVAHFILDTDVSQDYMHEYSKNMINRQLKGEPITGGSTVKDQYFPISTKNADGTINVKYKKHSELSDSDKKNIMSPLRQFRYSDLDWEGKTVAIGFNETVASVPTKIKHKHEDKDTNYSHFIFPNTPGGKNTYGKYGGGSVVFIVPTKDGEKVVETAGSLNHIKKTGQQLIKKYGITEADLIMGYHDLGSFSAKPAAKNGELSFTQWSGFNNEPHTGGGLAIPQ